MAPPNINNDYIPSKRELDGWIDKYGPLFYVLVEDREFLCRGISRREYKQVTESSQDTYEQEEKVCKLCVLIPRDINLDTEYAGLAGSMAAKILEESGFGNSRKVISLMNKYNKEMEDFMNQVSCIINEAFPLIDIDEVEDWSLEKTLWYYSRATWKMRILRGMQLTQNENGEELEGDTGDFPELAAEKAFMSGKMR